MDGEKFVIVEISEFSAHYHTRDELIGKVITPKTKLHESKWATGWIGGTFVIDGSNRSNYCCAMKVIPYGGEKEVDRKIGCGLPYGSLYKRKIKLKPRT